MKEKDFFLFSFSFSLSSSFLFFFSFVCVCVCVCGEAGGTLEGGLVLKFSVVSIFLLGVVFNLSGL